MLPFSSAACGSGQWALSEVAPGRLFPWLGVAFGTGIVLYFTADREPALWAALPLAALAIAVAFPARRSAIGFPLTLGFAGVAVATLNTARLAHPVLRVPASSVRMTEFVEVREERERSDRIVVHVASARRPDHRRPWSPPLLTTGGNTPALRPAARDATPRIEDLQEGD
jgi:competence protein ComEC